MVEQVVAPGNGVEHVSVAPLVFGDVLLILHAEKAKSRYHRCQQKLMPQLQANILIADQSLFIREGLQEALQKTRLCH